MGMFNVVFVEPDPFNAPISQPAPFTADIKRLINPFDTTATAADVVSGKTFYDKDGKKTTGTYIWDFKGFRPELIDGALTPFSKKLSATSFPSWTPSTTASTIVSSANVKTYAADMTLYEYLIHWRCTFDAVYVEDTTKKAAPVREIADIWQSVFKRPNSVDNIESSTFNSNACVTLSTTPLLRYFNSSGADSYTYSISYGIYPAAAAATFSNATTDTPTITIKRPSFSASCSSTYFSTTMATKLDQDKSMINMQGEFWRVPKGAVTRSLYDLLISLYNNPLT